MLWGLCSEWKALNLVIFFSKNQMDVFSFLQQLTVNNDGRFVSQPGVLGGHLWECAGNLGAVGISVEGWRETQLCKP